MSRDAMPGLVVFVYFKASPADDERIARQLAAMQGAIGRSLGAGSRVRFGHRRQESAGQRTWLESYELPRDTDAPSLLAIRADCAAAAGLDAVAGNALHIEVFDMRGDAPCA